jgi:serpin B
MAVALVVVMGSKVVAAPHIKVQTKARSSVDLTPAERAAQSVNAFAFDLYRKLAKAKDDNIFFSPQNISAAFAMLYPGAEGETEREFRRVFHYGDESAADMGALQALLNATPPEAGTVSAANSIWPDQDLKVHASYLDLMKKNFGAEITPLNYKKDPKAAENVINDWVNEKTEGKIQKPIDGVTSETRMVLVSAIYFNANWSEIFPKANTKEEPFYKTDGSETKVNLMHKEEWLLYYMTDDLQAVRLFYAQGAYSMLVLLPREKGKIALLENLEKSLSPDFFQQILQSMKSRKVRLFLPKFTVATKYDLGELLIPMGLGRAFSDAAQFPKLAEDPLKIDWAIHQAFVDVYEEGTEAAAFTGIGMMTLSIAPPIPVFRADHPFVYFILETGTDAILFMGRYAGPEAAK